MGVRIPPSALCHLSGDGKRPEPSAGFGAFLFGAGGAFGFAGGLVVAAGVDGEVAEEFAGGGVDDPDVEVVDEDDDVGSGVGSSDADVAEPAGDAQGDGAAGVDAVSADAVVRVGAAGGCGFGPGGVDGGGSRSVWERPVRSVLVVDRNERVEECLELGEGCGGGLRSSHCFRVCWNRSTLPQVVGWLGRLFFWWMPSRSSSVSSPLRPPRPPAKRVVKAMPLSVSVEAGGPWVVIAARKVASTIGPVTGWWAVTDRA